MTRLEQRKFVQDAFSKMLESFRDHEIGPLAYITGVGTGYTKSLIYFLGLEGAQGALRHLADTAHIAVAEQPELDNDVAQRVMSMDVVRSVAEKDTAEA